MEIKRTRSSIKARGLGSVQSVADPIVRRALQELQDAIEDVAQQIPATDEAEPLRRTFEFLTRRIDRTGDMLKFHARTATAIEGGEVIVTPEYPIKEVEVGSAAAATATGTTLSVTMIPVGWELPGA